MKTVDVRGYIVPDEDARVYRFFGITVTSPRDIKEALKKAGKEPVTVKINSYGGDVWSASDIFTELMEHEPGVDVEVTGLAASAATVIMTAGRRVRASPTAEIMIHNPMSEAKGDYRAMEHAAQSLRNTRESIVNAYVIKSGLSREKLRSLLNAETWMTPQSAKEHGLVDEIMFTSEEDLEGDMNAGMHGEGGTSTRAAAMSMPSAEALRAKWSVYHEFAPEASSVDEAREMIAGKFAKGKHPESNPKPAQEDGIEEERFNFLKEQIKVMAM